MNSASRSPFDVLSLPDTLVAALMDQSRAAGALECCGLLLGEAAGSTARVNSILPTPNVAADTRTAFEIDHGALVAAHRAARGGGPAVIGHYHSHPTGDAAPSPRDRAAAIPDGRVWIIVAEGEIAAWQALPGKEGVEFRRLAIQPG